MPFAFTLAANMSRSLPVSRQRFVPPAIPQRFDKLGYDTPRLNSRSVFAAYWCLTSGIGANGPALRCADEVIELYGAVQSVIHSYCRAIIAEPNA